MTSLSGITPPFYRSDTVAVADRFDVRRRRGRGRGGRADAIHDAPQIAVGDRLAVLTERDDRVVHLVDLVVREREAERFAAALHGVAAGVAAEHEPRRHRLADVLGPHDLIG